MSDFLQSEPNPAGSYHIMFSVDTHRPMRFADELMLNPEQDLKISQILVWSLDPLAQITKEKQQLQAAHDAVVKSRDNVLKFRDELIDQTISMRKGVESALRSMPSEKASAQTTQALYKILNKNTDWASAESVLKHQLSDETKGTLYHLFFWGVAAGTMLFLMAKYL